ncbi:MAG: sigma-70 family RNA polymerase sigma factor [Rhodanobacter sp.]
MPSPSTREQDNEITTIIARDRVKLRHFIRRRVINQDEAEDILQDVLYELVQAYRLLDPIEQVSAWLFRVARNRIIDRFRKKKEEPLEDLTPESQDELRLNLALPASDGSPEADYLRTMLLEQLHAGLDELPATQRDVFIAHELEGRSFKELASESGVPLNTLLARKRYAVLHLRVRLQSIYEQFDI